MKKIITLIVLVCFVASLFLINSCAKEEVNPVNSSSNNPGAVWGFTWTAGGTTVKADSGFYFPQFTNIIAYKNGASVNIILSSLNVGTYSISSATGNTLDYEDNSYHTYSATHGSVAISSNASNKMSGSFSASFSGSVVTNISGEFSNLPERQ